MPAPRSASARPGSSERGSAARLGPPLGLGALGDDAAVAAGRVERDRPRRARAGSGVRAPRSGRGCDRGRRRAPPAARCGRAGAGPAAPAATASETAAAVPHSRSSAGEPLLPGAGEHGADEVLARERDVERAAEVVQLLQPAQDLAGRRRRRGRSRGPGRARSARRSTPRASAASIRSENQRFRCSTDVVVGARRPVGPRRALDVHQHVAAAASRRRARTSPRRRRRCR